MIFFIYALLISLGVWCLAWYILDRILPRNRSVITHIANMVLFSSLWSMVVWLINPNDTSGLNLLLAQLSFIFAGITSSSFLLLAYSLLYKSRVWTTSIIALSILAVCILLVSSGYVVSDVAVEGEIAYTVKGILYVPYVIMLMIFPLTGVTLLLYRAFRLHKSDAINSRHFNSIAITMFITTVVVIISSVILPSIKNNVSSSQYTGIAVSLFSISVLVFTLKRRLLDTRYTIIKVSATLVVLLVFVSIIMVLHKNNYDYINITITIALLLTFHPIVRYIYTKIDQITLVRKYKLRVFTTNISNELARSETISELMKNTTTELRALLNARYVYFYIDKIDQSFCAGEAVNFSEKTLIRLTKYAKKIHTTHYVQPDTTGLQTTSFTVNKKYGAVFIVPFQRHDTYLGYMVIGKRNGYGYTERDITALNSIQNEVAITIQSALSIVEIEDINNSLQEKIEHATRKLKKYNKHLIEMDKTKDDFMSMASHNLRTPLTSIKGYVSGVLEGDAGDINDMQRMMLTQVFNSSNRMVGLVGDLLNLSRIQSGKFILIADTFSIVQVVEEEIETVGQLSDSKKVTIQTHIDKNIPDITADREKIRQVIMNLIDNAVYYSKEDKDHKGIVTVSLTQTARTVSFMVIDNGIGVPEAMQEKLFGKFYRADNAKKQRPDGTGIGLYMAKQVIDLHKGKTIFKSKEGKGSTFGFTIPKK